MSGPREDLDRAAGKARGGVKRWKTPHGHGLALSTPDAPLAKSRPKEGNGRHGRRQNKEEHE
ncbi:hypothetical protein [Geobacillus thermoleovorans]|nr:hypothetical protein [Geobacillus thermoleovorans]MBW7641532.1 hypothetical protein [Geobacillus thermoleovorans]